MVVRDNIHWNCSKLLSYNKPFNWVISPREPGKSTDCWRYAMKLYETKKYHTVYLERNVADMTESKLLDVERNINKFREDDKQIKLVFKISNLENGICDVYVNEMDEDHFFFRYIALSLKLRRLKGQVIPKLALIFMDEFICNVREGESYLQGEVFKFKELYTTLQREGVNLRVLMAGNPYSLYNPYFSWKKVPTKKLYPGNIIVGDDYAVEVYQLLPELREYILSKNPLYQFDDSYTRYAFDGRAVNDEYIHTIEKQPPKFTLQYVFRIEGKYLGVYLNQNYYEPKMDAFWVGILENYNSSRRDVAVFDTDSFVDGSYLLNNNDKKKFNYLKNQFRYRRIAFKTIEESYLFEQVYQNL